MNSQHLFLVGTIIWFLTAGKRKQEAYGWKFYFIPMKANLICPPE